MSRRTSRTAAARRAAAPPAPEPTSPALAEPPPPAMRRPWLLATAALLQLGWLGFLAALAIRAAAAR